MAKGEECGGREGRADAFQRQRHSVRLSRTASAARSGLRAQMGRLLGFAALFVGGLFLAAPAQADPVLGQQLRVGSIKNTFKQ